MTATRTLGLLIWALLAGGCHVLVPTQPPVEEPESDWGPLAVVENTGGMEALAEGIVRIDRDCVWIGRRPILLVWDTDRTRWEPPGRILFERTDGEIVVIENGRWFSMGGGYIQSTFEWVNPPNAGCPESHFLVSDVSPPD